MPAMSRGTSPEVALIGVYEISKILTAPRRLEVTLANVVNILSSMLQMRHGMICILDGEGDPDMVATTGWTPEMAGQIRARVPQKAIDQIVATQTPLVVQDMSADPLFEGHEDLFGSPDNATVSFIGVPIKAETQVMGTLSIDRVWDGTARFRFDEDVRFLSMVANLVGQTVRLHKLVASDRDRLIAQTHRLEKALKEEKTGPDKDPADTGAAAGPSMGIVGDSPLVKRLIATAQVVARSNSTVLLRGESGTGKELFARAIHELSPRKSKPFVKVNCAALPEAVLESELFGHEKGAFTGALSMRQGRFELAHGGTLFLDEIGEISPSFQAKLLRVLQEGEFERVGGNRTLKVDVRLVCATNKNLEEAVSKGEFRADLYYRIHVVPLILPPLRERPGDIPKLAKNFLDRFNKENKLDMMLSAPAIDVLRRCYFPGNVRELENCVRRTATLAHDHVITPHDFACDSGQCLSAMLWKGSAPRPTLPVPPAAPTALTPLSPVPLSPAPLAAAGPALAVADALPVTCPGTEACPAVPPRQSEKEQLLQAMERSGWVQAKAARLLNLSPRQIGYALRKHGIDIKRF
ncbi:nif-specific transcriptional activator NifA [Azorhizobium doebereinerae]|uniref:nif-specific transcriptional activator NifA n=1 Tax=Azorhizobium doebereinerae TaxID=281091 RepID=UPI0006847BDD|nr:nif-specific transcriptional activator NifA [Azorhizobium doebereinerae]